jgi:hypothetical protein
VYSEVVAEALEGGYGALLEEDGAYEVVRPHPLRDALPGLMALRIDELGKADTVSQVPVANLTWNPDRWLSRLSILEGPPRGDEIDLPTVADPALTAAVSAEQRLLQAPPPPDVEAPSALRVLGAELTEADSLDAELMTADGGVLGVLLPDGTPASTVLVTLSVGRCAVVPAFRDRVATLTVEDDRLVDLRYEPITSTEGHGGSPPDANFEAERARVAAATRFGLPWWREFPAEELLERWPDAVHGDPAFAVYLAYALADSGRRDLVADLLAASEDGVAVYDLALLAEDLTVPHLPSLPLLSRGWSLLGRDGIAEMPDIPARVTSPWTLFSADDVGRLHERLENRGGD